MGGEGTKNFARKGDNSEKGGRGVDVEMGGRHSFYYFFYYSLIEFTVCVWGEKVKFVLLHFDSSVF